MLGPSISHPVNNISIIFSIAELQEESNRGTFAVYCGDIHLVALGRGWVVAGELLWLSGGWSCPHRGWEMVA